VSQQQWASIVKKTFKNDGAEPYGSWGLQLNPSGTGNLLSFYTGQGPGVHLDSPAALPTGRWVHVAGTFDRASGARKLYVDGALVASASTAQDIAYDPAATGDVYLGKDPGSDEAFQGTLDDVGIWARALTPAEIESLVSSTGGTPGGGNTGDTTAPVISGVTASGVATSGATISWTTDEASDTAIEYGTTTSYGATTPVGAVGTSHSQALTGLAPNTLYHYRVRSRDAAGNTAVSGDQTFTTAAFTGSDTVAPTAAASAAAVTSADDAGYTFTVTYSDNVAVSVATIDGKDVLVTGPNGYSQLATLLNVSVNFDGSPRSATYHISAPAGSWDKADNGTYSIALQADQVRDTVGNSAAAGSLAAFEVNVAREMVGTFGMVNGRATKLRLTDADGTLVNVVLSGGGTALAFLENGQLSLEVTGTSARSVLGLTGKKGDGRINLGNVRVAGALRGLKALTADVRGTLAFDGAVGTVAIGNLAGGTVASAGGMLGLAIGGGVNGGRVFAGLDLGSDGQVGGEGADADTVNAASIGRITIRGAVAGSVFAAGVLPGNGMSTDGADVLAGGTASRIMLIAVSPRGSVDGNTSFKAGLFGRAQIGRLRVTPAADERFDVLT
jgi:hypothetical protein